MLLQNVGTFNHYTIKETQKKTILRYLMLLTLVACNRLFYVL